MQTDDAGKHGTGQRGRPPVTGAYPNNDEGEADQSAERWHPPGHFEHTLGFADPALKNKQGAVDDGEHDKQQENGR